MSSKPLLSIENLAIHFRTAYGVIKAVNNVSIEVARGEAYGIVGESGSGKSVTGLGIMRLLPQNAKVMKGSIVFNNDDILSLNKQEIRDIRGKDIAMIFQDPQASFDPVFTIANQIGEAINIHQNVNNKNRNNLIVELLKMVGIPEAEIRKDQYPHQFSGGMKQRAMSAMALSNYPKLIIADEPTTSLDVTIQAQIIALFKELKKKMNVSILLITHDSALASWCSDTIINIDNL